MINYLTEVFSLFVVCFVSIYIYVYRYLHKYIYVYSNNGLCIKIGLNTFLGTGVLIFRGAGYLRIVLIHQIHCFSFIFGNVLGD